MLCPSCNTENTITRLYCSNCGSKLNTKRHICGFINGETDKYCGGCGLQLIDIEDKISSKQKEANPITLSSEKITEEDLTNILAECSEKFATNKTSLTQEEIEKLFKE